MVLFGRAQSSRTAGADERSRFPARGAEWLAREVEGAAREGGPEQCARAALAAFVRASGAAAGALLAFDPHEEVLSLVAEQGLAAEGRRRLARVGEGDPEAWEMPLHGLLARRAYLIEAPARNRYVPRLVEYPDSVRSIACLPLRLASLPVGAMVLVARAPGALSERDLHLLAPSLSRLARLLEGWGRALRQGAAMAGASGECSGSLLPCGTAAPAAAAGGSAEREECAGLAAAAASALSEAACAAMLEQAAGATREAAEAEHRAEALALELGEAERERSRALAEIERLRAEVDELRREVAAREVDKRAEALALELGEAERERSRALGEVERVRAEVAALRQELAVREAEMTSLRWRAAELEAAAARIDEEEVGADEAVAAGPGAEAELHAVPAGAAPPESRPEEGETRRPPAAPVVEAEAGRALLPVRSGPAPLASLAASAGNYEVVVLDSSACAWKESGALGCGAGFLPLDPGALAVTRELRPRVLLLNLAAPLALAALAALRCREAGAGAPPVIGCLALPGAGRGILLGNVELSRKPLSPADLVALLGRCAPGGARVLTLGDDVECLLAVRRALAARAFSVSMAWDAKQAAGLLEVVRPDVVVIDLDLPRHDGLRALARSGGTRQRPRLTVLVSSAGSLPPDGVRVALGGAGGEDGLLALGEMVATVLAAGRKRPARARVRGAGQPVVAVA